MIESFNVPEEQLTRLRDAFDHTPPEANTDLSAKVTKLEKIVAELSSRLSALEKKASTKSKNEPKESKDGIPPLVDVED